MKRLIFIMLLIPAGLLFTNHTQAQLSVSINIGNQPSWAPEGYDDAQYYYIPDMDIYYPINQKNAYRYHDRDRKQYAQYKGQFDQHPIRDSKDDKYARNRNNWNNNRFKGNGGNDKRGGDHRH